ncbi:DUF305 domain-containing protein [Streptomyces griseoincarnatus]|uniref:DUF305 domain-containing protein n=1 Tax=Streptomyces TaxID=1883 RepID=UPI0006547432|nr:MULTISPECIES: DUF305 domain-containing protein [unclassified Streptomyces]AXI87172.1 DUF305 domain-containing protein [Streptomyces sp. ETH9427]MBU5944963.1 DUF305 domain-containing protein [Streptomyces sp. PAM3C]MUT90956.1 DUF305 domain-containing protein [Streptomyces sp. Z38]WPW20481.1 DUF305 domain-containing protein [Streptomyces griseoincarnatus]
MTSTRSLIRSAALGTTAVAAALVLAACGSDTGSGTQTSASAGAEDTAGAHNDQDVSFAQDMIPHHQQAIQMSKMAASQASSAEVKDLAARIEKAQDPEIDTMSGWLESWGEDVPSSMPGMDHGGDSGSSGMPGMMHTEDMDELMEASGRGFDTMFLTMMVEHHEGAVEMATTEKDKGQYGPAKKLADDIITAQNAEIEEMNKLLGKS